jgi:hypothetical protein
VNGGLKPTEQTGRVADVNAGLDDIFGNNCTGSYDHMVADRNREDGGIGSHTHMIAKSSRSPKIWFSSRSTVAEQIVNEHRAMGNEAVVADRDQIADKRVGLNPAALSNGCSLLYLNERSDERFVADVAAVQVCRFDDSHVCAEPYVNNPNRTVDDWIHTEES